MSAPHASRARASTPAGPEPIPPRLSFIWLGHDLPLFAELALRSAVHHHPSWEVWLWHSADLARSACARVGAAGIRCQPIEIDALLDAAASATPAGLAPLQRTPLREAYHRLSAPAARSNLLRLLALYAHGGIYLDTDTLTLKDLSPLRALGAFCGTEHLLWPRRKLSMTNGYFWLLGPALSVARWACARLDSGHRHHRQLLPWYSTAANNAVMGFSSGHPLVYQALQRIAQMPAREQQRRFRLGTHLLQETLEAPATASDTRVHQLPPEAFYPLGPVISAHYFRPLDDVEEVARELLSDTYVVHWYASVSDLRALDERYLREHAARTLYAHLCAPHLRSQDDRAR